MHPQSGEAGIAPSTRRDPIQLDAVEPDEDAPAADAMDADLEGAADDEDDSSEGDQLLVDFRRRRALDGWLQVRLLVCDKRQDIAGHLNHC